MPVSPRSPRQPTDDWEQLRTDARIEEGTSDDLVSRHLRRRGAWLTC